MNIKTYTLLIVFIFFITAMQAQSQTEGCRLEAVGPETATAAITAAASPQFKLGVEGEVAITAADYCEFLNATAATDSQNRYDEKMESDLTGACVTRAGEPGSYHYAKQAVGCRLQAVGPETVAIVMFISAQDAAQYCSWKNNSASTSTNDFNCCASTFDQELKSNQLTFYLINLASSSSPTQPSSDGNDEDEAWKKIIGITIGISLILGAGEESPNAGASEDRVPRKNGGYLWCK